MPVARVEAIIQAYAEAYDMGYDTQEAADAVFVEIVCDSEAGINYFAMEEQAGTPHFMENVHYGTQADMSSRDTRGPPVDGETHFSRETERFLRNFTGEVRYDEYLYLSDVEVATIRSNIKSRATYLSKTAVDGLVWAHSLNRGYAYTFLCNPDYSVTVTDVLDAESDIAIINRTTERMINYARTGASVRRNSSLNGQQRNGNQPSNNSGGTHAQTSQSQGTKGLVGQPSQSNRQGSVGTGAQNRTNSGADKTRNTQKVKFSREKDIRFSREQKQEVNPYGQDGKAEDHASFIRRMHEGSRRVKQVREIVFGYTPSRLLYASKTAEDTYRELKRLGIKCFLHKGLEYNFGRKTYKDPGETGTLSDGSVAIYDKAFGDGIEYAGHEAFHVWKHSTEWRAYVETLRRNINISSSVYGIQQADTVLRAYFDGDVEGLCCSHFLPVPHAGTANLSHLTKMCKNIKIPLDKPLCLLL